MRITILSENTVPVSFGLTGEHGFSVLIEKQGKSYLYDTGQTGSAVTNARVLKADLGKLEKVVLSHGHYDHCNGLEAVLREAGKPLEIVAHPGVFEEKYMLKNGTEDFIGIKFNQVYLENQLKASFCFETSFTEIGNGIFLSGTVPFSNTVERIPDALKVRKSGALEKDNFEDENSLFIRSARGIVAVLGCAHRGTVNILSHACKMLDSNIYAVIGGMHLHDCSPEHLRYVAEYLRQKQISLIAPAHCTGTEKIAELKSLFPSSVKPAICGSSFEFEDIPGGLP